MRTVVSQHALKEKTAELLCRVESGERLTITRHGRPVAELSPIPPRREFISRDELLERLGGVLSPADDLAAELWADDLAP